VLNVKQQKQELMQIIENKD